MALTMGLQDRVGVHPGPGTYLTDPAGRRVQGPETPELIDDPKGLPLYTPQGFDIVRDALVVLRGRRDSFTGGDITARF